MVQEFLDSIDAPETAPMQKEVIALRMLVTNTPMEGHDCAVVEQIKALKAAIEEADMSTSLKVFLSSWNSPTGVKRRALKSKFELVHRVMPYLYVGGWTALKDGCKALSAVGVTHVLGIGTFGKRKLPGFVQQYDVIYAEDNNESDLLQHFPTIVHFIDSCTQGGGVCYVHCGAGISRAPTACAAFLIHSLYMPAKNAVTYLRKCRPGSRPNKSFLLQLSKWERTCPGRSPE